MNHWEIQLWWHNKTLTGPPHHTEIECATPERTTHIFIANSFLSTQLERQTPGKTYFAIFLSDSFSFQMLFSCWLVHVTNNQQRFLFCFVLFFLNFQALRLAPSCPCWPITSRQIKETRQMDNQQQQQQESKKKKQKNQNSWCWLRILSSELFYLLFFFAKHFFLFCCLVSC